MLEYFEIAITHNIETKTLMNATYCRAPYGVSSDSAAYFSGGNFHTTLLSQCFQCSGQYSSPSYSQQFNSKLKMLQKPTNEPHPPPLHYLNSIAILKHPILSNCPVTITKRRPACQELYVCFGLGRSCRSE